MHSQRIRMTTNKITFPTDSAARFCAHKNKRFSTQSLWAFGCFQIHISDYVSFPLIKLLNLSFTLSVSCCREIALKKCRRNDDSRISSTIWCESQWGASIWKLAIIWQKIYEIWKWKQNMLQTHAVPCAIDRHSRERKRNKKTNYKSRSEFDLWTAGDVSPKKRRSSFHVRSGRETSASQQLVYSLYYMKWWNWFDAMITHVSCNSCWSSTSSLASSSSLSVQMMPTHSCLWI